MCRKVYLLCSRGFKLLSNLLRPVCWVHGSHSDANTSCSQECYSIWFRVKDEMHFCFDWLIPIGNSGMLGSTMPNTSPFLAPILSRADPNFFDIPWARAKLYDRPVIPQTRADFSPYSSTFSQTKSARLVSGIFSSGQGDLTISSSSCDTHSD